MNLEELDQKIPHKWRVQSFSKNKAKALCVGYIDARDAQKILDKVCGKENWKAEYYFIDTLFFCRVGIKIENEWLWKTDIGSESNIEKEKGHCSDAFKRACVVWGIGRFLYDLDFRYVDTNEKQLSNNKPYVIDGTGKRVWDLTKFINNK